MKMFKPTTLGKFHTEKNETKIKSTRHLQITKNGRALPKETKNKICADKNNLKVFLSEQEKPFREECKRRRLDAAKDRHHARRVI
jgi:hypothetical protein